MANHPELEAAIDDIVNESITHDDSGEVVSINMDKLKQPETINKKIAEEFENVISLLQYYQLIDELKAMK
jgi:glycine cleavage system H lipoate-binding protein